MTEGNHVTVGVTAEGTLPRSRKNQTPPIAAGAILRHYEIIRPLGSGGMGTVFLARDRALGRLVAIKFIRDEAGAATARFTARFLVEARTMAQINHQNIVVIHELGEHFGQPYIVLEYLKGRTFEELLAERRAGRLGQHEAGRDGMSPLRIVELVIPVVRALVCTHEQGIIHRDLKPANIMLTDSGVVKVLDFGIAKFDSAATRIGGETFAADDPSGERKSGLTALGARVGTAAYMSPEQWEGLTVDAQTDVWAVGMVMAELVLGRHPFADSSFLGSGTAGDFDAHGPKTPIPSFRDTYPDLGKLGSMIDRCLIVEKADRMGSARELLGELESLLPEATRSETNEERNPFPGLFAFQQGDADRFYGRSRAIAEVVARLGEEPLMVIVAPTGAGKSSFVRAGVIPALSRAGDAVEAFTIRPGSKSLAALAELLLANVAQSSTSSVSDGSPPVPEKHVVEERERLIAKLRAEPGFLGTQLRARARRKLKRIVLFVDQFEELFTLTPERDRATFFACLAGVADDPGSPLRVIVAIRSEFLDRIAEAHATMTPLSRAIMLLAPMDRDGLREALVRPIEAAGYSFERDTLVDEMLDTLEHTSAALPLLSFTAATLWELRDRSRRLLTETSYQRIGGVVGTLANHADSVLEAMSSDENKLARTALLRLVTPERTRALCTLGELGELGASPADMERVLGRMIEARLLAVEGGDKVDAMVELVHESLITSWPTLSRWLAENQEDAAFLSRLRHAAREWQASNRSDGLLWRGQAAHEARHWRARYSGELAPTENRYLSAVIALADRRRWLRVWAVVGVIVVLTLTAGIMSILAVRAEREAVRAQAEARQARNATRIAAAREWSADPTTVLALLREVEPPEVPRPWSELTRLALQGGVARAVFTELESVNRAAWSPDGTRIATVSHDKLVRVRNADGTGEPLVLSGHLGPVWSVAWSPDSERLATASEDRTARVWNANGTGEPLILRGNENYVWSAGWSPDGERVVTTSEDGTVRVWSAETARELFTLRGHEGGTLWAAWSPDGTRIATGGRDKRVRVWRADGKGEPLELRGHDDAVCGVAWSTDGERIASGSFDKSVRIWRADGAGEPHILHLHDAAYSVAWSPTGELFAVASGDGTVAVYHGSGTGEPMVFHGHEARVWSAAWSPDGTQVVTASHDNTTRVFNVNDSRRHSILRGHEAIVSSATWHPDGTRMITASADKTARVWAVDKTKEIMVLRGHNAAVWSAGWSPDGTRIVTAAADGTARLWTADGTPERELCGHEAAIWAVEWSPDGTRIVTASQDKTARIWSTTNASEPVILRGHDEAVWSAAFSPDGTRIVTASLDMTARIWSADGRGESVILRGHKAPVWSVAWSPDGKRILTGSQDTTARIWDANGTNEPLVLRGHDHWVNWVDWSPDGKRIVTSSQDKSVRVWDADGTGEPLVFRGAHKAYNRVAFSPDGKSIAASSDDHTTWVWTDLEPLAGVDDPILWKASTYCMSTERRIQILDVPATTADLDRQTCLRKVEEAHKTNK